MFQTFVDCKHSTNVRVSGQTRIGQVTIIATPVDTRQDPAPIDIFLN
jgi:hypothetical protein